MKKVCWKFLLSSVTVNHITEMRKVQELDLVKSTGRSCSEEMVAGHCAIHTGVVNLYFTKNKFSTDCNLNQTIDFSACNGKNVCHGKMDKSAVS